MALRSFQQSKFNSELLVEKNGFELRSLLGAINGSYKFIANLHGQLEDPTNWVFTERRLNALLALPEYNEFIRDCIKYCTIVMVGLTATDKAVISHFSRARRELSSFGPHFWISDTDDFDSISVVEGSGIQVLTYKNADGSHKELLEIIDDIRHYVPRVDRADPVTWVSESNVSPKKLELSPKELLSYSPNELRIMLNDEAQRILLSGAENTQENFHKFCKDYSRAILLASTFEPDSEDANEVLGYQLSSFQKEGGFGRVWRGFEESSGEAVAIKSFRYEIREKPELLEAFRRGVRSMRLLQQRGIQGVVKFLSASEVPPVVIMEWVEGATLYDAVLQGGLDTWHDKISALNRLAQIIYAAHNAPERVLHRDLRPQNIMLRNYYSGGAASELVVLDFDLSWHVGALERSVYVAGGTAYLAPEQIVAQVGSTTRSAAVDSFGFGMTSYFVLSKEDPTINLQQRADWERILHDLAVKNICREWRSIPRRYVRLIQAATLQSQSHRLLFSEIVSEMNLQFLAIDDPEKISDAQAIAEEVFARTDAIADYFLNEGWPTRHGVSGLIVEAKPLNTDQGFKIVIRFLQQGFERFQDMSAISQQFKSLPGRISSGFLISSYSRTSAGDYSCTYEISTKNVMLVVDKLPRELGLAFDSVVRLLK